MGSHSSNNTPGGFGTNSCSNSVSCEYLGSAHNAESNSVSHIDMGAPSTHPGIDIYDTDYRTSSA